MGNGTYGHDFAHFTNSITDIVDVINGLDGYPTTTQLFACRNSTYPVKPVYPVNPVDHVNPVVVTQVTNNNSSCGEIRENKDTNCGDIPPNGDAPHL